jgi:hypothetical protein
VRATVAAERAGVRSACIVTTGFIEQAQAIAGALGTADISIIEYPGVVMTQSEDELVKLVREEIAPRVIAELMGAV